MVQENISNENLPVLAFPNLLRGMSQFKKTGVIHFNTEKYDGELVVQEGILKSIKLSNISFETIFLNRLLKCNVIPESVFKLLSEENLKLDQILEIISIHEFESYENLQKFRNIVTEDLLYSLLDESSGSIKFILHNSYSETNFDSSMYMSLNDDIEVGGRYPCQMLLDYVEAKNLIKQFCVNGNYLSLQISDSTKTLLLGSKEKMIISFAEFESSVHSVLDGLFESRLAVGKLLLKLQESGVIDSKSESTVEKTDKTTSELNKPIKKVSDNSVDNGASRIGLFSRANAFLISPKGIELFLALLIPVFTFCYVSMYNDYANVFFDEVRSITPN